MRNWGPNFRRLRGIRIVNAGESTTQNTSGNDENDLPKIDLSRYLRLINSLATYRIKGRVAELTGLVVKAVVPGVRVGELCYIESSHKKIPTKAEVVGFKDREVLLMPLGELEGIGPGNDVIPTGSCLMVRVGDNLLGRVIDGLGDAIDTDQRGP
jgi:type III secretion protein N (ATPase)